MKVTSQNGISIYTLSGSSTSRSLPDWLIRKRKRSLKNDVEFQHRVELVQDFEFEEASQCIRVSSDGEYAMATGTYKPQHHTYHLPSLALKYARHHVSLNLTFMLLSSDYTKSLHLQTDRMLEFHTPMGCHYTVRIPRYGRALGYQPSRAEVVVPASGREVYRLDLEAGRFLKPFELEAGVESGESIAIEQTCHGLVALGTDRGTVEFWDHRSRDRIGVLTPPPGSSTSMFSTDPLGEGDVSKTNPAITALEFHPGGLVLATGNAVGITTLYDVRSPRPLLTKDQQYGFPIQTLKFLHTSQDTSSAQAHTVAYSSTSTPKVLSADKRVIKIWDQATGAPWTSIEPAVDINHVELVPDSGMIFTANEGREMHSFFIPQLGPAPQWCSFLDNITEELAEAHLNDPDAYKKGDADTEAVSAYENFKFLSKPELVRLGLDGLVGTPQGNAVLRPYMHGYFIDQRLYEEFRMVADPFEWERERRNMVQNRIEKERESRIRSTKRELKVKVNKRLAERLVKQSEKHKKKKERAGGEDGEVDEAVIGKASAVLKDERFGNLFEDPDFEVDENTLEYVQLHPAQASQSRAGGSSEAKEERKRGRTAVESEEDASSGSGSGSDSNSDSDDDDVGEEEAKSRSRAPLHKPEPQMRISNSTYRKSGHNTRGFDTLPMKKRGKLPAERSFGARVGGAGGWRNRVAKWRGEMGEREVTFFAGGGRKKQRGAGGEDGGASGEGGRSGGGGGGGGGGGRKQDYSKGGGDRTGRRSASGNVFRGL